MSPLLLKLIDSGGQSVWGGIRRQEYTDGNQMFSVYDTMTKWCAYRDSGATARSEFKRQISKGSEYRDVIVASCYYIKFPGRGQRETPCMTLRGLLVLANSLGDKISSAFRDETFSVLQRFLDGDTTMCAEILKNQNLGKRKSYTNFVDQVAKRAHVYTEKESQEQPPVSYVYATKSEAFPNLIKIGRTSNLAARLSSLNTSCAPAPHVVIATAMTLDSVRDEALAHTFFASTRKEGEFFEVSLEDVESFFVNHITNQYKLESAKYIPAPVI